MAAAGSSSGSRKAADRSEFSVVSDPIPGVSISVVAFSCRDGQSTTSRSTSAAGVAPRSMISLPSRRLAGSCRGAPSFGYSVSRGTFAYWYQVTSLVHSAASVAATISPTMALSNVDLPALTLPAMATRSGASMRSSSPRSHRWVSGDPRYASMVRCSSRRAVDERSDALVTVPRGPTYSAASASACPSCSSAAIRSSSACRSAMRCCRSAAPACRARSVAISDSCADRTSSSLRAMK